MSNVSPSIDLFGRGLAATGALLWMLSMSLTFYSRDSQTATFWELQRYTDVVTFVLAVVVLLIVTASLFLVVGDAMLPAVAVIGGYLLALDVSGVIEARNLDVGAGGYVGILGAAAIAAGAVVAIAPKLAESAARDGQNLADTDAEWAGETNGAISGWYADPANEARLRYWDGSRWSDSTKAKER